MADYPDIHADVFQISVGPFGVILTLRRADPPDKPEPSGQIPTEIVGRVRMSNVLAQDLAQKITETLKKHASKGSKEATISH